MGSSRAWKGPRRRGAGYPLGISGGGKSTAPPIDHRLRNGTTGQERGAGRKEKSIAGREVEEDIQDNEVAPSGGAAFDEIEEHESGRDTLRQGGHGSAEEERHGGGARRGEGEAKPGPRSEQGGEGLGGVERQEEEEEVIPGPGGWGLGEGREGHLRERALSEWS